MWLLMHYVNTYIAAWSHFEHLYKRRTQAQGLFGLSPWAAGDQPGAARLIKLKIRALKLIRNKKFQAKEKKKNNKGDLAVALSAAGLRFQVEGVVCLLQENV